MSFSVIGTDVKTHEPVHLYKASRLQSLYCLGSPGTGKSTLFENLIIQDAEQDLGILLIDPHGDLIQSVLSRMPERRLKDVIYLNFPENTHPFGLNLLECKDPTDELKIQYILSQVKHVFEKAYGINPLTPRLYDYLSNCAYTLIVNKGSTLLDLRPLLTNRSYRTEMLKKVKNEDVLAFWDYYEHLSPMKQHDEQREILNKLNDFSFPPLRAIIGQVETTLDFRKFMDSRKIVLLKLEARLENATALIGGTVISLLLNAAYSREDIPKEKRKQFHVYIDEFHRVATDDCATLISEGRKWGVGCNLANQNLTQLDRKNRAAVKGCANLVVFRVSGEDAQELKIEFKAELQQTERREEPKRTPVLDPIGHLCSGRGIYPHKNVQRFVETTLKMLHKCHAYATLELESQYDALNTIIVDSMKQGYFRGSIPVDILIMLGKMADSRHEPLLSILWLVAYDEGNCTPIIRFVDAAQKAYYKVQYCYDRLWGTPDAQLISDIEIAMLLCWYYEDPQIKPHLHDLGFNPYNYLHTEGMKKAKKSVHDLLAYINEIKDVLQTLAHYPITDYSGIYEELPSQPELIANAQNRTAIELANLPKLTAKIKILQGENPIEHMIQIPPSSPSKIPFGRIADIRLQNHYEGFIRKSKIVEWEIQMRHKWHNPPFILVDTEPVKTVKHGKPTRSRSDIIE